MTELCIRHDTKGCTHADCAHYIPLKSRQYYCRHAKGPQKVMPEDAFYDWLRVGSLWFLCLWPVYISQTVSTDGHLHLYQTICVRYLIYTPMSCNNNVLYYTTRLFIICQPLQTTPLEIRVIGLACRQQQFTVQSMIKVDEQGSYMYPSLFSQVAENNNIQQKTISRKCRSQLCSILWPARVAFLLTKLQQKLTFSEDNSDFQSLINLTYNFSSVLIVMMVSNKCLTIAIRLPSLIL